MKKIFLTQGQFTIVDDEDYEWLNQYSWHANYNRHTDSYYAERNSKLSNGKRSIISMHRQILGLEKGDKRQGDHIHHDTLDNRRSELRIVTHRQNKINCKSKNLHSSIYAGVSWYEPLDKWVSKIRIGKERKHLGYFTIEKEASEAYQNALLEA